MNNAIFATILAIIATHRFDEFKQGSLGFAADEHGLFVRLIICVIGGCIGSDSREEQIRAFRGDLWGHHLGLFSDRATASSSSSSGRRLWLIMLLHRGKFNDNGGLWLSDRHHRVCRFWFIRLQDLIQKVEMV